MAPVMRTDTPTAITHVTSARNTTLKRLRSLHHKKYRRSENLFMAEGLRICTEALEAGWVPEILLLHEEKADHPLARRLVRATIGNGGQVLETDADLLSTVSGKDNPQAVIAAFRPRETPLSDYEPAPVTLVAERLRDPGNLGTLLRSCDATGAGALILVDACTDPTAPEAVRASMGAFFTVPTIHATTDELLRFRTERNARLVGAALSPSAVDYREADYRPPTLLLLGNEAQGLPAALMEACDTLVQIPMRGRADSLNVAMAGTVLLYEAIRCRASTG